jgi:peptide/nickel transport system permease protein
MLSYILRRTLYAVPILLGVLVITFFLFRGLQKPDTIAKLALGQKAPSHAITAFKEKHHLDRPMHEQFGLYLKQVVTLDFGESWKTGRKISETFIQGALPTLLITIPGLPAEFSPRSVLRFTRSSFGIRGWTEGLPFSAWG